MNASHELLDALGWSNFFSRQLTAKEREGCTPARVVEAHRDRITVLGESGERKLEIARFVSQVEQPPIVGDWLLVNRSSGQVTRVLEPRSSFQRLKPGYGTKIQRIAANVDTLFVVSSCNEEFNVSRIERYLVLAHEADVEPVVVLTKADLAEDAQFYRKQVEEIDSGLAAVCVDARSRECRRVLAPWLVRGRTVALLGSSGTGKSTLLNTLAGEEIQKTSPVRRSDKRGRHTTTRRSLHVLESGGILIDSPGLRELQLATTTDMLTAAFGDIAEIALGCKFSDCRHEHEPGCAVLAAVTDGTLDSRRLDNYKKLVAELATARDSVNEPPPSRPRR